MRGDLVLAEPQMEMVRSEEEVFGQQGWQVTKRELQRGKGGAGSQKQGSRRGANLPKLEASLGEGKGRSRQPKTGAQEGGQLAKIGSHPRRVHHCQS